MVTLLHSPDHFLSGSLVNVAFMHYKYHVCLCVQRQMRELMVRAMYCEMLGYEASFAYIHAIKLAQQGTVLEKRVGMLHTPVGKKVRMLDDPL